MQHLLSEQHCEYGRHFFEASDFSGSLLDACIEETLRLESPVQRMGRFSTEDIELEGEIIEQGHRIILMLGAANRDPRVFSDPDRYWPERPEREHLAFGYGHHFCSGAMLARTEARVALQTLFSATRISLPEREGFEWHENVALRALRTLPVQLQCF
ncbi:hypothetical protein OLMES_2321 [Oleiphilus messinensis]|uniref:Cytochrome P450 n=1 Tax=Oleiphilus messinensis TaxID=141451 RepID=A0A1Y0IAD3_9GAMM|nr:cytochrome P450 [Oleiphilus messinensis]ARU56384.1 hypothetical protein OLMES_2321 [Oleiphilus messinensis]